MSLSPLICTYCGNRTFVQGVESPECLSCANRYVPEPTGDRERFADPDAVRADHRMDIIQLEEDVWRLHVHPVLGIRHYAWFIERPGGNVLMDMQPLLTDDLEAWIASRGGLKTIILSHPHYYGAMDEFSARFEASIRMHVTDKSWPAGYPNVEFFDAETLDLDDAIRVHHIPAQFEGGLCLLYARHGGILFTGDTIMISPSTGELTSWKNTPRRVPYHLEEYRNIRKRIMALKFDQIYASVRGEVRSGAKGLADGFTREYLETTAVPTVEEQRRLLEEEREVPESETFFR